MWASKHTILLVVAVQVAQAWRHVAKSRAEATLFREGQPTASISSTPASHISYGHSVWLSTETGHGWLSGAREERAFGWGPKKGNTSGVVTGFPTEGHYAEFTYEWQVRSNAGNGNIGGISEADPKAGQCVEYGDVVMLQVQSMANRWLSGARFFDPGMVWGFPGDEKFYWSVQTLDHLGSASERALLPYYSWQVRSNAGTGNVAEADPRAGQCVSYKDVVFLQVQGRPNSWLSGGRYAPDNDPVWTFNHLDGGNEQTIYRATYLWKLGHRPTTLRVAGQWILHLTVHSTTQYALVTGWSKTVTDEFTSEVEATASAEFSVFGKAVSAEMSARIAGRTSSSITRNSNLTHTVTMSAAEGAFVWAWVFFVDRGDTDQGYVTTKYKVQADTRPHCFPGEQDDAKYTKCRHGGCLENCWPFKVGDQVLIAESARTGEITKLDSSDRPFYVTFSDGPGGWYPESALSLVTSV